MKTATINLTVLKAAAIAASSDETRYYLQGVLVEIDENAVRYVATDGHILFAATRNVNEPNTLIGAWIIPSETIKAIKLPRGKWEHSATLYSDGVFGSEPHQLSLVLKFGEMSYGFHPIDGTFPDWRRVLPQQTTGDIFDVDHRTGARLDNLGFEPDRLGALWRISKALDLGDKPSISYNGAGPALVTFPRSDDNDTFAVIMPSRVAKGPQQLPDWARVKSGETNVAQAA